MFEQTILYSYSRNHSTLLLWLSSALYIYERRLLLHFWFSNLAVPQICFRRGLPPGDGVLFYPGEVFSSSHEPVASTRLERILSGMQVIILLIIFLNKSSFWAMELEIFSLKVFAEKTTIWTRLSYQGFVIQGLYFSDEC
jgi:hypothetical protein